MSETKSQSQRAVFIVEGARTPFLKAKGSPGAFSASTLGVMAAKRLLSKQSFDASEFSQVIVGCAAPSEDEANIARVIALRLGCGDAVPAWTVQRNCASGLQAIDSAFQSIQNGQSDLVLAGGVEAMSRAPLIYNQRMVHWLAQLNASKTIPAKLKAAIRFRPNYLVPVISLLRGLTDPIVQLNMGQTAEELAYRFHIARQEMDEYAAQSHQRVIQGQAKGAFEEIEPIYATNGCVFEADDGVRTDSTVEKLSKLKPVFDKFGNITAGNSSQISDGGAFVILASEEAVKRHHLPVLAKIEAVSWAALNPAIMGLGPVHAMSALLKKTQVPFESIEHIEINEAFAAQVLACTKAWQDKNYCQTVLNLEKPYPPMDSAKLNPQGGAIAIGHPVGASGARLVLHCAKSLVQNKQNYAMASLCIGGGQGGAILIKRA